MLNTNDKKGIAVVILLLIIILGSLVFIRGCNRKEFVEEDVLNLPEEVVPDGGYDPSQSSDSNIDNTDTVYSNSVIYQEVLSENPTIPDAPVLDFETYYQVEIGSLDFSLPVVSEVDNSGNPQVVIITYYFKSIYANDYVMVDNLSFKELGTFRVNYQVTDSYQQTTTKDLWIDVIDETAPIIEGLIEEYDESSGLISYIPVNDKDIINEDISITFRDNDKVVYANYYKAIYENIGDENTLEQEALMNVIDIDLTTDFYLSEEGEYHIRAYDEAGNYTEYVVTIDKSNPVVEVTYTNLESNQVLVTITSLEEISEVNGFTLSEDKKSLTKIYSANISEEVTVKDLAGNEVIVPILVDQIITVNVMQNGTLTESTQLNLNDGDIIIDVLGNANYEIVYSLDSGGYTSYISGSSLTLVGHYDFTIYSDMGTISFSLDISNQGTSD